MMNYDFDQYVERRGTESIKWMLYSDDVLPLWLADMDFAAPEPVSEALRKWVEHGVFGYGQAMPALLEIICERLERLYDWYVTPEQIIFFPGLVSGLNVVCRAIGEPGDAVLLQPPVYFPFLTAALNQSRTQHFAPLSLLAEGTTIRYEIDYAAFEEAITPRTRLLLLSNPHNPIGQMHRQEDLERIAAICLRHDMIICSDEIHCDLLLDGQCHQPLAVLSPEIADRCITLMAPSKTFNLAGLGCGFAIVRNPELRTSLAAAAVGIVPLVPALGYVGAMAAFQHGAEWLSELLCYLTANRDFMVDYVAEHIPAVRTTKPEATYLAWLDCSAARIEGNPQEFFLREAKVALNDGAPFGPGGEGFVRLNFACPRATLRTALERMRVALANFP